MTVKCAWCEKCKRLYFILGEYTGLCPDCECDRDCEHCPYPDCRVEAVSQEEIDAAERRDKIALKERKKCGAVATPGYNRS